MFISPLQHLRYHAPQGTLGPVPPNVNAGAARHLINRGHCPASTEITGSDPCGGNGVISSVDTAPLRRCHGQGSLSIAADLNRNHDVSAVGMPNGCLTTWPVWACKPVVVSKLSGSHPSIRDEHWRILAEVQGQAFAIGMESPLFFFIRSCQVCNRPVPLQTSGRKIKHTDSTQCQLR